MHTKLIYLESLVKVSAASARWFCMFAVLFLSGMACQSKNAAPPAIEWDFQPAGIQLHYRAADDLNLYSDSPHTLMLAVYQLTDASDFMNYTRTADGIRRLLQLYDIDRRKSVSLKNLVDVQTHIVNPGTEKTLKIDRVEKAEWVGVVAGYFDIVPQRCSAIFPIPVERTEKGFIRKKINARPGDLVIELDLGAHAMHRVRKSQ